MMKKEKRTKQPLQNLLLQMNITNFGPLFYNNKRYKILSLCCFLRRPTFLCRQCKMHKRRADLLEGVAKELNPTYYLTPCRELWFELGETYSAMLDIKISRFQVNVSNLKGNSGNIIKIQNILTIM